MIIWLESCYQDVSVSPADDNEVVFEFRKAKYKGNPGNTQREFRRRLRHMVEWPGLPIPLRPNSFHFEEAQGETEEARVLVPTRWVPLGGELQTTLRPLANSDEALLMREVAAPQGPQYVLADAAAIFCGKSAHHACGDVVRILRRYSDLAAKCSQEWIAHERSRPRWTSVAQLVVLIEFIFLLPGKAAARARAQAAQLLLQQLCSKKRSGELYKEVVQLEHVRKHWQQEDPEDWAAALCIEDSKPVEVTGVYPAGFEVIDDDPGLVGERQHLYLFELVQAGGETAWFALQGEGGATDVGLCKPGVSEDPCKRAHQVAAEMKSARLPAGPAQCQLRVLCVWVHGGRYEKDLLKLKEFPAASLGLNLGSEWRQHERAPGEPWTPQDYKRAVQGLRASFRSREELAAASQGASRGAVQEAQREADCAKIRKTSEVEQASLQAAHVREESKKALAHELEIAEMQRRAPPEGPLSPYKRARAGACWPQGT